MSRIGKRPVRLPAGVTAAVEDGTLRVKGPKGELARRIHPEIRVDIGEGELRVVPAGDTKRHSALQGLTRTLVNNMVMGVTEGFRRQLEIQGVGYKAEAQGQAVRLSVGFSHPVVFPLPPGIKVAVENNTLIKIEGIDKELVGQVAAEIRRIRPPEPYKGKGIRYVGEHVRRKAGKTGGKA